ncbi:MAG: hypothetical protein LQ344_005843 [Seirophora lacunosa]|nr:MAG: hypothetical protein LQ344_005843 [Seirophora lacunosa]
MRSPEILVHAAAPSRGSDDTRYRKEALGILRFDCIKRHDILPTNTDKTSAGEHVPPTLPQDSNTSTDPAPRLHLTNALTNWATPTLTRPSPKLLVGRTPAPPLRDRASLRAADVLIHRTPIDQQRPKTAPSGPSTIQETPNLPRVLSDSFETPPSIIPDSQPTPCSQQKNRKRPLEENSSPSPTRHAASAKRSKFCVEEEGEGEGEDPEEWTQPEDTSTPLLPDPPPSSPSKTTASPTSSPPSEENTSIIPTYRRRQSFPPYPKPGNGPFSTHLTPSLLRLQRDCKLFTQKVHPLRPIGALERGHWRFAIPATQEEASWDHEAREKMWAFLQDTVGKGRAGWNVWAVFEEGLFLDDDDAGGGKEIEKGKVKGRVKVFCWGEIVKEVFALLVVATDRMVKRWGAQWVDAGGVVVVDMGKS